MSPRAHRLDPPEIPPEGQMTIEEFLSFTETRPDGERWELIEGVAILQASPSKPHQVIATNIGNVRYVQPAGTGKPLGAPGDLSGVVGPPREVTFQMTYRF